MTDQELQLLIDRITGREYMTPPQLEAHRAEQQRLDDEQRAAHAEELRKQSAHRAFIEAGGTEAEFEEAYPGIRKQIIRNETLRRVGQDAGVVGSVDPSTGQVRW